MDAKPLKPQALKIWCLSIPITVPEDIGLLCGGDKDIPKKFTVLVQHEIRSVIDKTACAKVWVASRNVFSVPRTGGQVGLLSMFSSL